MPFCKDIIISRFSEDKTVNTFGKHLIHLCEETDMIIANGRVGNDKGIGKYTCYNHSNSASVTDLVITPADDMNITNTFHCESLTEF